MWLNVAGVHAVVRWHWSHAAVVGRWFDGLPVAVLPLWQVEQVPAATPEWLNVAGVHAVVRWHWSHAAVVGTWFVGLPVAVLPLWQVSRCLRPRPSG